MNHIKHFNGFLNESDSKGYKIPQDRITFKGEVKRPKKEVLARINEVMKHSLPKIVSAEVYMDTKGLYSGDGESTCIKLITEKGNEIIYKYVHKGNSGEERPGLTFVKNADGERVRFDFWGREFLLKNIEKKNIQIPSKKDVEMAHKDFLAWAKQAYGIDSKGYNTSDSSDAIKYLEDNMYMANMTFNISERTGKSLEVSVDMANGTIKVRYGRMVGGTSDSWQFSEKIVNGNPRKTMDENVLSVINNKKLWKDISAEIDRRWDNYAHRFREFYKDRQPD